VSTIYKRSSILTAKVKIITKPVPRATEQIECQYLPTISYESIIFVDYDFLPIGQRVNHEFFLNVLRHVPEVMRKKRPNFLVNMVGFFSTIWFPRKWRRRARSYFNETKRKLQLFYSRPTAIISQKRTFFSPNLKCGLKGREFYSTQEKRKVAEQLGKFFPNPVRKVGKLKHCSNVYINPLKTTRRPFYLKNPVRTAQ